MDPAVAWYQPEQEGPAQRLWLRIWEAAPGADEEAPERRRRAPDNRASTYNMNENRRQLIGQFGGCPWRPLGYRYDPGIMGLHQEIEHFYEYMSPTEIEHQVRGHAVRRITHVVRRLWPQARVEVFGSYRTGLYLPTSDIDLVIIGNWDKLPLRTLESELVNQDIAEINSIKVLEKATVPIVKMTDKHLDIKVDISFNMTSGVRSAELIKEYKQKYPVLAKLVMVLKQFLLQRDLNEVFTGGISSYSLILMCISFLQLHPRPEKFDNRANLGVLLIEFFELYGRKFNYFKAAIRVKDGGSYVSKEELQKEMSDGHRPSPLCIEDPLTAGNDIGRSSYGALQVKTAFDYGYIVLQQAVTPMQFAYDCNKQSILGRIIRITDNVLQYRLRVKENFETKYFTQSNIRTPISNSSPVSLSTESSHTESDPDQDEQPKSRNSPNNNQTVPTYLPSQIPPTVPTSSDQHRTSQHQHMIGNVEFDEITQPPMMHLQPRINYRPEYYQILNGLNSARTGVVQLTMAHSSSVSDPGGRAKVHRNVPPQHSKQKRNFSSQNLSVTKQIKPNAENAPITNNNNTSNNNNNGRYSPGKYQSTNSASGRLNKKRKPSGTAHPSQQPHSAPAVPSKRQQEFTNAVR